MRICVYVRVSTDKQDVSMQLSSIEAYVRMRGLTPTKMEIFRETGSGKNTSGRPVFNEMFDRIKKREFDLLIVWKLDRLSRSVRDLLLFFSEIEKYGCLFASVTEQIDLTSAMGKFVTTLLGSVAEYERALISERQKESVMERRGKPGRRFGARPVMRERVDLELASRLRQEGWRYDEIGERMGVSASTVFRALRLAYLTNERAWAAPRSGPGPSVTVEAVTRNEGSVDFATLSDDEKKMIVDARSRVLPMGLFANKDQKE